jgi:hypothetical protein
MTINTDKLVFQAKFREAAVILAQAKTGAKMYPTTRENIIALIKRGHQLENLKTYFTPESIADATKVTKAKVQKNEKQNES